MGIAPVLTPTPDDFFVFIQTSLVRGLVETPISGVRNGSNFNFTLATAPPAGSSLMFYFNGALLNQVVAAPTPQQFTISGLTIVLGLAPTAADFLIAYIEDTASLAFFHSVQMQGTATNWSATASIPSHYSPIFAVFVNGQLQEAVTTTPASTQYKQALALGVVTLTFGFPLTSADNLQVYLIGLSEGAAALPSLPRYLDMQNELLVLMNEQIDLEEAKMCLNRRWQKILNAWSWSFVKTDGVITTKVPKSGGSLSVSQGSPLVAGTGTSFAVTDVDAYLLLGNQPYRVMDVQVVSPTVQMVLLNSPYPGATNATLPYQLYYKDYALDADVVDIVSLVGPSWPFDEMTQESLDVADSNRSFVGQPSAFIRRGMVDGIYQIELWPVPDARYTIHYSALTRSMLTNKNTIIPDVAEVLLMAAEEMACGITSSKRAAEKDYPGAQFWAAKGTTKHGNYLESLQELKSKDRRRFSGPSRGRDRSLSAYVGVAGYDVGV